jgi:hypothetical protein
LPTVGLMHFPSFPSSVTELIFMPFSRSVWERSDGCHNGQIKWRPTPAAPLQPSRARGLHTGSLCPGIDCEYELWIRAFSPALLRSPQNSFTLCELYYHIKILRMY